MRRIVYFIIMTYLYVLYNIFMWPFELFVAYIYPESTQRNLYIWLDDNKEKVRFSMFPGSYRNPKQRSVGMKIKDWKSTVFQINSQLDE